MSDGTDDFVKVVRGSVKMVKELLCGEMTTCNSDWEWLCGQEEGCRRKTRSMENKSHQNNTVFLLSVLKCCREVGCSVPNGA